MAGLNYRQELSSLKYSIGEKTLNENHEIVELILANINSLYGLITLLDGSVDYVFPINTPDRSKKFLIMVYAISVFQLSSSIAELTFAGEYPEASMLMRSLIENVAFAEYYSINPPKFALANGDIKRLPARKEVFRYLTKNGRLPKGGPILKYKQYNNAAHATIDSVVGHWAEASGQPQITSIWIRRYNYPSFYGLMRDMVIPLIAIKQLFKDAFSEEIKNKADKSWLQYWQFGHDFEKIHRLFPGLDLGRTQKSDQN